jgi:Flp pilus assembly protein TadG
MRKFNRIVRRVVEQVDGSSFVEIALVLPFFLLILVPSVDLARAFYAAIEVSSAAEAGAVYGVQNPGDVTGMVSASNSGASNLTGFSANATYGCECSDGSSVVASCTSTPSCTYNYVNYSDVVATAVYVPTFKYPGLPSSINITRESRLRAGGD